MDEFDYLRELMTWHNRLNGAQTWNSTENALKYLDELDVCDVKGLYAELDILRETPKEYSAVLAQRIQHQIISHIQRRMNIPAGHGDKYSLTISDTEPGQWCVDSGKNTIFMFDIPEAVATELAKMHIRRGYYVMFENPDYDLQFAINRATRESDNTYHD